MCDRCEFGEIIDKAISAGLIVPDGHQAFARMFEDSPADGSDRLEDGVARRLVEARQPGDESR